MGFNSGFKGLKGCLLWNKWDRTASASAQSDARRTSKEATHRIGFALIFAAFAINSYHYIVIGIIFARN